jgi:hypothetical protein
MNLLKAIFLFFVMLNYNITYSQNTQMNKSVEDIIALGKDSIVQLALELIDFKLDPQNLSEVNVITNGEIIYVSFRNPIKYLPLNSVYYFEFGVNLLEKVVTYGPISNGTYQTDEKIPVYTETRKSKKAIQFVLDAINKSDELGSIDIATFADNMEIRESQDYYDVLVVSDNVESMYKVEKASGKIYDLVSNSLIPPTEFEDEDDITPKFKVVN